MATLLQLPAEVVRLVVELLPSDGLFSLRQTCHLMNVKTWNVFIRDYFESRNVMLQRQSLKNLQRISEHPTLRGTVRTLRLCTEHLLNSDDDGFECGRHPFLIDEAWGLLADPLGVDIDDGWASACTCPCCEHRHLMSEQEAFLFGEDQKCLAQAMRNLPNCETLVLTDAHVPWGAAQLEREFGCEFEWGLDSGYLEEGDFVKYALDVMLIAAAESNLPMKKLDIYLGHMDEPKSIQPMSVKLLDAPSKHNTLEPGELKFPSLTSLRLVLGPGPGNQGDPDWEPSFARFLALFPQLSDFTLAFDGEEQYDHHELFPRLSTALSIPHLRAVGLARFETTVPELEEVLLRHQQTLEEVTLREIKLYAIGSWSSLLRKLWNMAGVRRLTLNNCLMGDEWMIDVCGDMPEVVHITDESTFAKVVAWIEDVNEGMVDGMELEDYM